MDRDKKIVLSLMEFGHAVGRSLAAKYGIENLAEVVKSLRAEGYDIRTSFEAREDHRSVRYLLVTRREENGAA